MASITSDQTTQSDEVQPVFINNSFFYWFGHEYLMLQGKTDSEARFSGTSTNQHQQTNELDNYWAAGSGQLVTHHPFKLAAARERFVAPRPVEDPTRPEVFPAAADVKMDSWKFSSAVLLCLCWSMACDHGTAGTVCHTDPLIPPLSLCLKQQLKLLSHRLGCFSL